MANPLDPALLVARLTALPPVPGVYTYRNQGNIRSGDAAEQKYPATMTRAVQNVVPGEDGNFTFDVAATVAGETTTTTYRVLNGGQTPDRGVYITQIVQRTRDRTSAFTPTTPLLLLPFPSPDYGTGAEDEVDFYRGQRYRSVGTDGISQTTVVLEATLLGKIRTDACGKWIDAFDVEVTLGRIISPNRSLEFTGHYAVATQYGALIVEDDLHTTGTDQGIPLEVKNRSRITVPPTIPAGTTV